MGINKSEREVLIRERGINKREREKGINKREREREKQRRDEVKN